VGLDILTDGPYEGTRGKDMSEMIVRVADAIKVAKKAKQDSDTGDQWWTYDELARAAITAMREPTEKMIEPVEDYEALTVWHAMIDEALKWG
jgi:hypothetical protein